MLIVAWQRNEHNHVFKCVCTEVLQKISVEIHIQLKYYKIKNKYATKLMPCYFWLKPRCANAVSFNGNFHAIK